MPVQLRKTRFTIIEMIWVIVVIAIILGMGAAAMTGIGTHKGSEGGARMMARMLELSRQFAITENTRVALILPMAGATMADKGEYYYQTDTWNRVHSLVMPDASDVATNDTPGYMCRPAIVDRNNVFQAWVTGTKWEKLPASIFFTTTDCEDITSVHMPNVTGDDTILDGSATSNGLTSVSGLIFKPTGSTTGTANFMVSVKPFSVNSDPTKYDPGNASVYEITTNWLTGKLTTVQRKKIKGVWRTVE